MLQGSAGQQVVIQAAAANAQQTNDQQQFGGQVSGHEVAESSLHESKCYKTIACHQICWMLIIHLVFLYYCI